MQDLRLRPIGYDGVPSRVGRTHLAFYEVLETNPGVGVRLRDLWTRKPLFVHEQSGSGQLARWDVLGARVVPDADGTSRFEGGV